MIFLRRPLFSVVMPSYNHAAFVKQSVNSVLNQGIKELELIVVDDGSSDGTPDLVAEIKDPRLTLIRLPENRKVHPRNLALGLAKGKYIAFQNSDDEWEQGKLIEQLQLLENNKALTACFTAVKIIGADGNLLEGSWADGLFTTVNKSSAEWLRRFFDQGNCLCLASAVIRSQSLKSIGNFRESLVQLADFDMWVRLAALGEFMILPQVLTKRRILGGDNASSPKPENVRRSLFECAKVLERYQDGLLLKRLPEIFPEITLPKGASLANSLAALGQYAWSLNTVQHYLFADQLFEKLFDKEEIRRELADLYGASLFKKFIKKRGELEILIKQSTQ